MITFNSGGEFTVKSQPTVIVRQNIELKTECGGITLPYEIKYDFTNVPKYWHNLFLQIIQARSIK